MRCLMRGFDHLQSAITPSAAVKKQLVQIGKSVKKTVTAKMQEGEDVSAPSILDKWFGCLLTNIAAVERQAGNS